MLWILLAMLGIAVLAGLVVVYVAYPHRGVEVPSAPWVGKAMRTGVRRLPTLDNQHDDGADGRTRTDAEEPAGVTVPDTSRRDPQHH